MQTLSALDNGFLLAESRETPMHVGGLYRPEREGHEPVWSTLWRG